jgi:hypothetical protein
MEHFSGAPRTSRTRPKEKRAEVANEIGDV